MPSHKLHKYWQEKILGEVIDEIDKIIDFPEEYFIINEYILRECLEEIRSKWTIRWDITEEDIKRYIRWLREHDQWRDWMDYFLCYIYKRYGGKYFKAALLHIILDSFRVYITKFGYPDILTFRKLLDHIERELEKSLDEIQVLYKDVMDKVRYNLKEILDSIFEEARIFKNFIPSPINIKRIEIFYDERTVNKENLYIIKKVLNKIGIKYFEFKLNEMSESDIKELKFRLSWICMRTKISLRRSRKYTLIKDLDDLIRGWKFWYSTDDSKDSIILIVVYKDEREMVYPHTPSIEARFHHWIYPTDYVKFLYEKYI